jgi:23S rRNA pseudouridine2605 synthase
MAAERLQKIIAAAGIASRRKSEELITTGRVQVNGQVVVELGSKADPEQDHIRVDGKLLQGPERFTYVALNKPKGYVTTVSDEKKRPTVMDLVQKVKGRVYPVGRLDWASEGLILMTNDGALANALMKASSNVAKVYVVKVAGQPDEAKLDKLRRGVSIAEKGGRRVRTAPAKIRLIREGDNPWLEVTIIEGRNRQVRKMFEEVGHHVEKIRRVQYGPLALDIPPGDWRNLTLLEVAKLKTAASGVRVASPPTPHIVLRAPKSAAHRPVRFSRPLNPTQPARSLTPGQSTIGSITPVQTTAAQTRGKTGKGAFAARPAQHFRPTGPSSGRPAKGGRSFAAGRPQPGSDESKFGERGARRAGGRKPSFGSSSSGSGKSVRHSMAKGGLRRSKPSRAPKRPAE